MMHCDGCGKVVSKEEKQEIRVSTITLLNVYGLDLCSACSHKLELKIEKLVNEFRGKR